ncbi:MAG: hypothetical protein WCR58_07775 [Bacteroidales bacterium]|nr:zf-HC2 domain-containing protein [Bacteroidales bacterium]MCK9448187.1 zf-HC2 domain-containing protein [Bacteroidales bacterium]MDD3700933.1 hypothetical protein [Bacteroidales bacterium]MDY0370007.1 hypothetical protein [Bacteroidales bacterium]
MATQASECTTYRNLMLEDIVGSLSATEQETLQQHLKSCSSCFKQYATLKVGMEVWRQPSHFIPDEEMIHLVTQKSHKIVFDFFSVYTVRSLASVAAAILIGIGIGLAIPKYDASKYSSYSALQDYYVDMISDDIFSFDLFDEYPLP